jgi:hypothetical protein
MCARTVISFLKYLPQHSTLLDFSHWLQTNRFAALLKQSSEVLIMKSLIKAVAIALVLAAPVASFAQSNQPLTRAEVRAQLIQIEKAGYNPSASDDHTYPADVQAAEAKVAAQNAATSGVGGVASGSSQSGARAVAVDSFNSPESVYKGH